MDVAARTNCGAVIGRVSKQDKRYTGSVSHNNEDAVTSYHQVVKNILESSQHSLEEETQRKKFLHLMIRGMGDKHGPDVEISSRNGHSCDRDLLDGIVDLLPLSLERYSRRSYMISVDNLFGGGSKYLDFIREGYPSSSNLPGFGHNHSVLEIRLSHTIRKIALGRIKDSLVRIVEAHGGKNHE